MMLTLSSRCPPGPEDRADICNKQHFNETVNFMCHRVQTWHTTGSHFIQTQCAQTHCILHRMQAMYMDTVSYKASYASAVCNGTEELSDCYRPCKFMVQITNWINGIELHFKVEVKMLVFPHVFAFYNRHTTHHVLPFGHSVSITH